MKIQQGTVTKNFWEERVPPVRKHQQEVVFNTPFDHPPYIILSLEKIDEGQFIEESAFKQDNKNLLHTVNRYDMFAQNISQTGFILNIETWGQNLIYGYRITWTALCED